MSLLRFFQGLMIVSLLHGGSTWAATYWVSKSGSDGNPCFASNTQPNLTSQSRRTIMAGAACLRSGDTLMIMPGNYNEYLLNPLPNGATLRSADANPRNWFVLKPQNNTIPANKAAIDHRGTTRSNITYRFLKIDLSDITAGNQVQNCLGVSGTNTNVEPVTLEDFECIGPAVGMVNWSGAGIGAQNFMTIRRGVIRDFANPDSSPGIHGVYWQGNNGLIEHVWIENLDGRCINYRYRAGNNVFRNNVCKNVNGISAVTSPQGDTSNHLIYNSIFWNTTRIELRESGQRFYNNVVYDVTGSNCIRLQGGNHDVRNNIFLNCSGTPINNQSTGSKISHNITSGKASDIFVDHTTGNFSLKPSAPAVDAGMTITDVVRDFAGTTRPQGCCYDIGAFEYVSPEAVQPLAPSNMTVNVP